MWVLIVLISTGGYIDGHYVTTQEFTSQFKCQVAEQMIRDTTVKWPVGLRPQTICVEK